MNQLLLELIIHFTPQTRHVNIDNVIERSMTRGFFPNVAREHLTGDYMTLVTHQVLQEIEFASGQIKRLARTCNGAAHNVDLQIACAKPANDLWSAPATKCANAGEQFGERKWLHEIVVRTGVKAQDAILDRVTSCQHQYGSLESLVPQCRQDFESASSRKHHVQNQQVEGLRLREKKSFFASACECDLVLLGAQSLLEGLAQLWLILYRQNPHTSPGHTSTFIGDCGPNCLLKFPDGILTSTSSNLQRVFSGV